MLEKGGVFVTNFKKVTRIDRTTIKTNICKPLSVPAVLLEYHWQKS